MDIRFVWEFVAAATQKGEYLWIKEVRDTKNRGRGPVIQKTVVKAEKMCASLGSFKPD